MYRSGAYSPVVGIKLGRTHSRIAFMALCKWQSKTVLATCALVRDELWIFLQRTTSHVFDNHNGTFFSAFIPGCFSFSCCFVRAAVICFFSASTRSSCVICILSSLRIPFVLFVLFFVSLIFLVGVFVVFFYPVHRHSICLRTLINSRFLFFVFSVSQSVTT